MKMFLFYFFVHFIIFCEKKRKENLKAMFYRTESNSCDSDTTQPQPTAVVPTHGWEE